MNLQDAIKSGKPYKLKGSLGSWITPDDDVANISFTRDGLLSDKWEIEEEKIGITREQAVKALCDYDGWTHLNSIIAYRGTGPSAERFLKFIKQLGFKS